MQGPTQKRGGQCDDPPQAVVCALDPKSRSTQTMSLHKDPRVNAAQQPPGTLKKGGVSHSHSSFLVTKSYACFYFYKQGCWKQKRDKAASKPQSAESLQRCQIIQPYWHRQGKYSAFITLNRNHPISAEGIRVTTETHRAKTGWLAAQTPAQGHRLWRQCHPPSMVCQGESVPDHWPKSLSTDLDP